jgi:predicted Rossmann fold nucleotide-binding protein DprA/Smf involved in DNA uptake
VLEIEMQMSEQNQAVLLLTAWFGKATKGEVKPLGPQEWGRFALWLKEQGRSPEDLLKTRDVHTSLQGWNDRSIDALRIKQLLERGAIMGIALEKWERAGLWVITRSDPDYPSRLKRLLNKDAPPVLFGSGNRKLLDRGGVAVVGSRDLSTEELAFTGKLGGQIAMDGKSVVSGGARGADETAMLGALAQDGTVIGILADSLLRASNSAKYRSALMDGNLVLISPFNPEAGFNAGNAMARNKYIYCLADAAVVIKAARNEGGTWSGAVEALKKRWVPVWVKSHDDHTSGNAGLVDQGARWLPDALGNFDAIIAQSAPAIGTAVDALSDMNPSGASELTGPFVSEPIAEIEPSASTDDSLIEECDEEKITVESSPSPLLDVDLYAYFLTKLELATREGPRTVETLQEDFGLIKAQLTEWLKRAVAEGRAEKSAKPVRYRAARTEQLFP